MMNTIKYRFGLIKSYIGWEDYLGFAIFIIGVSGFIIDTIPFIHELRAELIGIRITVLIIDNANEGIKRREEKTRLILQMGSPDHAFAVEALRQLQQRSWLNDGSLRGAYLFQANLSGAYANYANLENTFLVDANLQRTIFWKVNLQESNLTSANLKDANWWDANLRGANLEYANMENIKLDGADLKGASLIGANLERASLSEAKVTKEQLADARSLDGVIMPDGTKYNAEDSE